MRNLQDQFVLQEMSVQDMENTNGGFWPVVIILGAMLLYSQDAY